LKSVLLNSLYLVNIQEKHKIDFSKEIDDIENQMFALKEEMYLSGDPDCESYVKDTTSGEDVSDEDITKKFATLLED